MSEATRLRLIADVPVGAFLSGGIDSSLVVSYMAEHAHDVRTFSIDFPHARFSEGVYAREVAAVYGTRHEDLTVDPDIIPTIAATVQAAGEPFADSSAIPTYLLSEMTRRRVTVALSGDGGDEAFAGYVRHRLAVAGDQLGPLPQLARPLASALGRVPGNGRLARVKRGALAMSRSSQERYAAIMSHFDPNGIERLCTAEFLSEAGGSRRAWDEVLRPPIDSRCQPVPRPRHGDLPARRPPAQGRPDVDGPRVGGSLTAARSRGSRVRRPDSREAQAVPRRNKMAAQAVARAARPSRAPGYEGKEGIRDSGRDRFRL